MTADSVAPPCRVLLVGANGQVGWEVCRAASRAIDLVALDRRQLDIRDREGVRSAVAHLRPAVVINAVAYTAVDRAEADSETAFAVNRDGSAHLAEACAGAGIPLLHLSTDYVFDGTLARPYREDDPVNPLGVYGASKWAGEEAVRSALSAHVILRVSWVFGVHGNNFVKTMLRLAAERDELRVVADQHGSPTAAQDIAHVLLDLCHRFERDGGLSWGTYHFTGAPPTTWHGFAEAIVATARRHTPLRAARVVPITTAEFATAARRPANSVLDCAKISRVLGVTPPGWQDSLDQVVATLCSPQGG